MRKLSNKGQIEVITPAVIALAVGAILLVMGLIMLDELQNDTAGDRSRTASNEVVTQAELKASTNVATAEACEFGGLSVTACLNGSSGGGLINSGNYSVGTDHITNLTSEFVTASWYCNYTYTDGGVACESTNTTIAGIGKFADYYDLIVLAIVISVVISLVIVIFSMRKQQ